MSAFVAVLERDPQRPARLEVLEALLADRAERGPDGAERWVHGPAALGYLHLETAGTPGHTGLLADDRLELGVCFDGHIDNREEVRFALGLKSSCADARLVAEAYARWGLSAPSRLVGEFAFVVQDRRHRRVVAARDALGVRPLFYGLCGAVLILATELRWILADGRIPRTIDEGMVGEYLACRITSRVGTLYQSIQRLEPGHLLVADERGLRIERYWNPETLTPLALPTHRDYVERFRETFVEAVRCRLPAGGPVGADLSGGVDSSSVVGVLASLERSGECPGPVHGFTLSYPGRPCDETEYARKVVEHTGIAWHPVVVEPPPLADYAGLAARHRDFPGHPSGLVATPMLEQVRARGIRVMLAGVGSDELLAGAGALVAALDALAHGRPDHARGHVPLRMLARFAAARGAERLLPRALVGTARARLRERRLVPWLDRGFVRRVHLVERLHRAPATRPGTERLERITNGWLDHSLNVEARHAADHQVEYRYPFLDQRLVELCLGLPEAECRDGDRDKRVLRDAMAGLVPEAVRERQTKASLGHLFQAALECGGAEDRFGALSLAGAGWVDPAAARAAYRAETTEPATRWALWMLFGLDLWYASWLGENPAP